MALIDYSKTNPYKWEIKSKEGIVDEYGESSKFAVIDRDNRKIIKTFLTKEEAIDFIKYHKDKYIDYINSKEEFEDFVSSYQGIFELTPEKGIQEIKSENDEGFEKEFSLDKIAYIVYIKGHRNSKGELAPWVIKSHETGKIISSHKSKREAEKHLKRMRFFKHKKALLSDFNIDINSTESPILQMLRKAIISEYDAINLYEQFANNTTELKEFFLDLAREEKVHVGELETLLKEYDETHKEDIEKGKEEVEEKDFIQEEPLKENLDYKGTTHIIVQASKFKFDPNSTENEGRFRLRDPKDFKEGTFRRWDSWAGIKAPEGVSFIVGELKNGKKALQAIRFDKKLWNEEKAGIFWNKIKKEKGFQKNWEWDKEAILSIYVPFHKLACGCQEGKCSNCMEDMDLLDTIYMPNEDIEYMDLKQITTDKPVIIDFKDTNPSNVIDDINLIINKLKSYFGNKIKGIIWHIPENCEYNQKNKQSFIRLIDNNLPNFIDIQNPDWYNDDILHDMFHYNANFLRRDLEEGSGLSNKDLYKLEIKDENDLNKLKDLLSNIEKTDATDKYIQVEYRGTDPKILAELKSIFDEFKSKYMSNFNDKTASNINNAITGPDNTTSPMRDSNIDDREELKSFRKNTPDEAYYEDYYSTNYPDRIDYKNINQVGVTDNKAEKEYR